MDDLRLQPAPSPGSRSDPTPRGHSTKPGSPVIDAAHIAASSVVQHSPLAALPLEVKQAIVSFLPQNHQRLFRLLLLCKAWYAAVHPFLWATLPLWRLEDNATPKRTIAIHASLVRHVDAGPDPADAFELLPRVVNPEFVYSIVGRLFTAPRIIFPNLQSVAGLQITRVAHLELVRYIAYQQPRIGSLSIHLWRLFRRLPFGARPISHLSAFHHLRSLQIEFVGTRLRASALRSLGRLTQLTSLRIHHRVSKSASDGLLPYIVGEAADVIKLARKMQNLEELAVVLDPNSTLGGQSNKLVLDIAMANLNLRVLKLGFDVDPVDVAMEEAEHVHQHMSLRVLAVGDAIWTDDPDNETIPDWYFDVLLRAFPSLELYKCGHHFYPRA